MSARNGARRRSPSASQSRFASGSLDLPRRWEQNKPQYAVVAQLVEHELPKLPARSVVTASYRIRGEQYEHCEHTEHGERDFLHQAVHHASTTMRLIAVLGSALFLVIAPGTILGLGPWWITRWRFESPAWEALPLRVVGAVLILAGVPILLESFARFALEGLGTPAPVAPPRHLVVTGVYRHVRNPIYVALTSIIVGQALLFGNVAARTLGAHGVNFQTTLASVLGLLRKPTEPGPRHPAHD